MNIEAAPAKLRVFSGHVVVCAWSLCFFKFVHLTSELSPSSVPRGWTTETGQGHVNVARETNEGHVNKDTTTR